MDPNRHHNALGKEYKLHWYEIKSILGQGGFGITYLAEDTNLDQRVAIKEFMPTELAFRDAANTVRPISEDHSKTFDWGLNSFLDEAKTLARFKHSNIVRVRSFFEGNNTAYMIMDYEDGTDLSELIKKGQIFDEKLLLDIVIPILNGLEQVHEMGFIHRDIKPHNIFIRLDGSPVLIDFGSARQALGGQTRTLTSLVTPGYAPFEQYHDADGKQGPWTDIYSMGATCYCAITGKSPTEALKRGMARLEHDTDAYINLADLKAHKYSRHFLEAIDCALRFRPIDRPQNVTDWKNMLTGKVPVPPMSEDTLVTVQNTVSEATIIAPEKQAPVQPAPVPDQPQPTIGEQGEVRVDGAGEPSAASLPVKTASRKTSWLVGTFAGAGIGVIGIVVAIVLLRQPDPSESARQIQVELEGQVASLGQAELETNPVLQKQTELEGQAALLKQVEEDKQETLRIQAEIDKQVALVNQAELDKQAVLLKQAELEKQAALLKQAELEKQVELARQAQAKRQAELEQQAEATRQAELERQAEAKRQVELERQAEAKRQAELAQQAEAKRQAELEQQAEVKRQAELALQAKAKRQADLAQLAEEKGQADLARQAEVEKQAELARQVEAKKQTELARKTKEKNKQAELAQQKAEKEKRVETARKANVARHEEIQSLLASADKLYNLGDFEKAESQYQQALKLKPTGLNRELAKLGTRNSKRALIQQNQKELVASAHNKSHTLTILPWKITVPFGNIESIEHGLNGAVVARSSTHTTLYSHYRNYPAMRSGKPIPASITNSDNLNGVWESANEKHPKLNKGKLDDIAKQTKSDTILIASITLSQGSGLLEMNTYLYDAHTREVITKRLKLTTDGWSGSVDTSVAKKIKAHLLELLPSQY